MENHNLGWTFKPRAKRKTTSHTFAANTGRKRPRDAMARQAQGGKKTKGKRSHDRPHMPKGYGLDLSIIRYEIRFGKRKRKPLRFPSDFNRQKLQGIAIHLRGKIHAIYACDM